MTPHTDAGALLKLADRIRRSTVFFRSGNPPRPSVDLTGAEKQLLIAALSRPVPTGGAETTIPGSENMSARFDWLQSKAVDMGYMLVPTPVDAGAESNLQENLAGSGGGKAVPTFDAGAREEIVEAIRTLIFKGKIAHIKQSDVSTIAAILTLPKLTAAGESVAAAQAPISSDDLTDYVVDAALSEYWDLSPRGWSETQRVAMRKAILTALAVPSADREAGK